jgi:drug/metabolite transporter (DMT)-like permease
MKSTKIVINASKREVKMVEPDTNRPKAILFQLIFGLLQFFYMLIFKGKVRSSGVDPTDFMVVRCIVVFVMSAAATPVLKQNFWPTVLKENEEKDNTEAVKVLKRYFWFRHFIGNSAYFLNILAMSNLPLGITMIIFNTAPFWSIPFGKLVFNSSVNKT